MKKQVTKCFLVYRGMQGELRDPFTDFVPIGLFNILKALLDKGLEVNLINLSKYTKKEVEKFIKDTYCQVVFISSFFGNHMISFEIAKLFKEYHKNTYTVIGGPISILGKEILKRFSFIDFVIKGEGEEASSLLIDALNEHKDFSKVSNLVYRRGDKIIENPVELIKNIDNFFFLPSQIIQYCSNVDEENFSIIITSRGCPFNCNFCSSPLLWQRKIRFHSMDLLLEYLKDLRKCFGTLYFSIRDDNFLFSKERIKNFTQSLIREKLYYLWNTQGSASFIDNELAETLSDAGCDQVQMGIESASLKQLKFLNKNLNLSWAKEAIKILRNNLIRPFGYFICGMKESPEEITNTLNFIKTSGLMDAVVAPLAIYPGAGLSKNYPVDIFFKNQEILYYDLNSFRKYKNLFLKTFEEIYQKGFSLNELNLNKKYSFKNNIVKYFAYRRNEQKSLDFLKEIVDREPKNPWGYYLLGKHFYKKNSTLAIKYLTKADEILNGKNEEIKKLIKKVSP